MKDKVTGETITRWMMHATVNMVPEPGIGGEFVKYDDYRAEVAGLQERIQRLDAKCESLRAELDARTRKRSGSRD